MQQNLVAEKLEQASKLVSESPFDVWITFVRETAHGSDPILAFMLEGSLTWQSALLIGRNGRRVAVVGNYDADALISGGHWHAVVPYVQDIKAALLAEIENMAPGANPRIAVNFSENDDKADGLSHGMLRLLEGYLEGTRFEGRLESAETLCMALRGRKTPAEITRMRSAIRAGDDLFDEIGRFAKIGVSETAVFDFVHRLATERGLGFSWEPTQDPIVNTGPNSMIGHGVPNPDLTLQAGHIFHIDLGVLVDDYASDIQRCWYVRSSASDPLPADVLKAFTAVRGAIQAGFEALKPGVQGWQIDATARKFLVDAGYEEYQHAFGHQVGRMAHDGGSLLGPKWKRYGSSPIIPVEAGEVFTMELGVIVEGRGYLGLEEMVRVTPSGCEWLSKPQDEMMLI